MHKRGREEDVISQQDKHTYESVPVRFRVGSHDYIKRHVMSGREKEQTIQNENHRNQRENRLILCDQNIVYYGSKDKTKTKVVLRTKQSGEPCDTGYNDKTTEHSQGSIVSHQQLLSTESSSFSDMSSENQIPDLLITDVSSRDVLCGRGGNVNKHPGNRIFRELIEKNQDIYLKAKKKLKPLIAGSIVDAIHKKKGRFLKMDTVTCAFYEIKDGKAREKTAQALREGSLMRKSTKRISRSIGDDDLVKLSSGLTQISQRKGLQSYLDEKRKSEPDDLRILNIQKKHAYQRRYNLRLPVDYKSLTEREKIMYEYFKPPVYQST